MITDGILVLPALHNEQFTGFSCFEDGIQGANGVEAQVVSEASPTKGLFCAIHGLSTRSRNAAIVSVKRNKF